MKTRHRKHIGGITQIIALWILIGQALSAAELVVVDGHSVHPTRLLARFRAGQPGVANAAAIGQHGFGILDRSKLVSGLVTLDLADPVAVAAAAGQAPEARRKELLGKLDALRRSGLFEYVELDYVLKANATPTDASFADGTLWGLRNFGQNGGVVGVDVGAVAAWDITTGSSAVLVAVIDTGIRYTHQDLVGQIWSNPGEIPGNGIDDDGNGYVDDVHGINALLGSGDPFDDNDHGTHVSGTIGALANGGGGHVGVAWQVRLMGCKFLDAGGTGSLSDAIKCIDYATANGAKIMNNSWSGGGYSQALYDSIMAARNAGVLFVAAAGNDGINSDVTPGYPAGYQIDNVVSVAAIDRAGALASFSNFGRNTVHLGAPGVAIYSSTASSDSSYGTFNGTSMASPHVAGVAALLRARFPGISVSELRQRLLAGVVPTASLAETITGGRVNALNSLSLASDGNLELSVTPPNGSLVDSGSEVLVRIGVTDLSPVNNATVSATVNGGVTYTFLNNGTPPDAIANDHVYTRAIPIPVGATNLSLVFTVTAPGKNPASVSAAYGFIVRPPNDSFANRIALSGPAPVGSGSNFNASREPGEPLHAGNGGGKSIWWSWTAPSNGLASVTTDGSNFDTVLGVYTGTPVSNLTEIGGDDDGGQGLQSLVSFQATAGTQYQIAVDGYGGSSGSVQLSVIYGGGGGNSSLSEALDAPQLVFSTGGFAPWATQGLVTHDGVDAAQSGLIADSQDSWLETAVSGPGLLTFWAKISSEASYDYLEFYIDGIPQLGRISGEVDWYLQSHQIPAGVHSLRWRYTKDGSIANGADAAWLDQLAFVPQSNLADAVDAPSLPFASGGSQIWTNQNVTTFDWVDAAQSGTIGNGQESWMETSITGPGTVRFWCKISSEENFDYLDFYIDGVQQVGRISGEVGWFEQTHIVTGGLHSLRWRYSKDGSLASGADAAWVDQFRFTPAETSPVDAVYVSSAIGEPWGLQDNLIAMDLAFGSGNWRQEHFQFVDAAALFSADSRFVYLEGGDGGADIMETFLGQNRNAISNWVYRGGSLFLNSAPNVGDGMDLGLGVSLRYDGPGGNTFSASAEAVVPAHPIFAGPLSPVGTNWTGSSFSHAKLEGAGFTTLVRGETNSFQILVEKPVGDGRVIFGTMTSHTYHSPSPNAANLRANILAYLRSVAPVNTNTPPTITRQPQSVTAGSGSTIALNVSATGAGPLTYQWRHLGVNIPGATSSNLVLVDIRPDHAGPYTVVVANPHGSRTSAAALVTVMDGQLFMGLTINGQIGASYRIDYQTVLGGAWQTLTFLNLPTSPYLYIDPQPASAQRRFYRAVHLP